jgi:hypothetical protein
MGWFIVLDRVRGPLEGGLFLVRESRADVLRSRHLAVKIVYPK